jgi:hypothetical protein
VRVVPEVGPVPISARAVQREIVCHQRTSRGARARPAGHRSALAGRDEEGEPGCRAAGEESAPDALAPLGVGGELKRLGDQLNVLPVRGWRDRLHRCGDEFRVGPVEPGAELKGAELGVSEQVLGKFRGGDAAGNRGLDPCGAKNSTLPASKGFAASRQYSCSGTG